MTRRGAEYRRAGELPPLLFVERAVVSDPISVEVDRPAALHPRVAGFWRRGEFFPVVKVVETRYEHGETYFRVVTNGGCVDLRRYQRADPRTLRLQAAWEVCADLDAVEIHRPT